MRFDERRLGVLLPLFFKGRQLLVELVAVDDIVECLLFCGAIARPARERIESVVWEINGFGTAGQSQRFTSPGRLLFTGSHGETYERYAAGLKESPARSLAGILVSVFDVHDENLPLGFQAK